MHFRSLVFNGQGIHSRSHAPSPVHVVCVCVFWPIASSHASGAFGFTAGQQLGSRWAAVGQHLASSWSAAGQPLGSSLAAAGQPLGSSWAAAGQQLGSRWAAVGQQLGSHAPVVTSHRLDSSSTSKRKEEEEAEAEEEERKQKKANQKGDIKHHASARGIVW